MADEDDDSTAGEEFRAPLDYFEESLDRADFDFWAKLAEHAPYAMDGYHTMRSGAFRDPPDGEIPRKYKELLVVAMDCAVHNRWGVEAHARAAVRHGATVEEVAEMAVLSILVLGMPNYRNMGYRAVVAAEEARAEYADEERDP